MGVTEVAVTMLALGLEASSGTQDPKFLLLRLLRAHGEFTEHYDNTGDKLSSGCPRLSSGPGCCIGYIKDTRKRKGLPPAELSVLLLLYCVPCLSLLLTNPVEKEHQCPAGCFLLSSSWRPREGGIRWVLVSLEPATRSTQQS